MQNALMVWLFGQLFGSKAKTYFVNNIAPTIPVNGQISPSVALSAVMNSDFVSNAVAKMLTDLKISPMFSAILTASVEGWVASEINSVYAKK
jgi:hypothetical protein